MRFKLFLGQRQPGIIWAKLARRPGYVLDAHRRTVPPAVVPGPVAQVFTSCTTSPVATHDKARRRLRLAC